MKKGIFFVFCLAVILSFLSSLCFAQNSDAVLPESYYSAANGLPKESSAFLPNGIYSGSSDEVADAVASMTKPKYLLGVISELLGINFPRALKLLAALIGIIVFSSIFSTFKNSVGSQALSGAVGFCSSLAIFGVIISIQIEDLRAVSSFFESVNDLFIGIIPATGVIYAMGGNISTAVASSGTLYAFLAFCENFCAKTIIPISSISCAFALCGALSPSLNTKAISSSLKKAYIFLLGVIMTVLVFVLSTQTVLSSSADNISARVAKLMVSGVIPVVGGSISETLRTVASSVGYLKSVCGIGSIFFVLLLLLPTLISLLLTRFVFLASGAVADMLGCEGESKLLSEIGGVYGTMIAVVSMVSVMFIFALDIFVRCAVATS